MNGSDRGSRGRVDAFTDFGAGENISSGSNNVGFSVDLGTAPVWGRMGVDFLGVGLKVGDGANTPGISIDMSAGPLSSGCAMSCLWRLPKPWKVARDGYIL